MLATLQIFNYSIQNQKDAEYDVHIDGDIVDAPTQEMYKNFWGDETSVSFRSFRNQVDNAKPKVLNVYVNSTGGHVGDAMAMHDYLAELEAKGVTVNRIGRGIIASAAVYLILNGEMTENSMMMVHNISMIVAGDIVQCENQVKAGRKFNDLIKNLFVNQTGKPPETVAGWMNKETWFTAKEAKDNGFISNVTGTASFSNSIRPEKWPFQNTAILNSYNQFTIKKEEDMDIKKIEEAISNGFSKFFGNSLPKDFKMPDNAATDFAKEIANALKGDLMTEEKVKEIANKAVEEATADDAVELGKVFVNKTEMTELKNEIIKSIGNKTTETTETKETVKTAGGAKNRFANKVFFTEATK